MMATTNAPPVVGSQPARWPAALRLDQAAQYCGLSVDTFNRVCPVKPIAFTQSNRGNRYLRKKLDEWLESIDPNGEEHQAVRTLAERLNGRNQIKGTQDSP
jgi:hypothetical protein